MAGDCFYVDVLNAKGIRCFFRVTLVARLIIMRLRQKTEWNLYRDFVPVAARAETPLNSLLSHSHNKYYSPTQRSNETSSFI